MKFKRVGRLLCMFLITGLCLSGVYTPSDTSAAASRYTIERTLTIGKNGKAKLDLKKVLNQHKDKLIGEYDDYLLEIGRPNSGWIRVPTVACRITVNRYGVRVKQEKYKSGKKDDYNRDHVDVSIKTKKGGTIKLHIKLLINEKQRAFMDSPYNADGNVFMDKSKKMGYPLLTNNCWFVQTREEPALRKEGEFFVRDETLYINDMYMSDLHTRHLIEKYNSSFELVSSETVDYSQLRKAFEGFNIEDDVSKGHSMSVFEGTNYNYVFTAQSNPDESDQVEVFRISKYDKNWNFIRSTPVCGINSIGIYNTFSLSCAESGNMLYLYTAHRMYKAHDGKNHQANLRITYDTSTDKVVETYHEVSNLEYGYVSHSFQQFVRVKGKDIYALDLGDAHPRGIYLARYMNNAGGKWGYPDAYRTVQPFDGQAGDNNTGCRIFGFEVNDENCIIFHRQNKMGNTPIGIKMSLIDRNKVGKGKINTITLVDEEVGYIPELYKLDDDRYAIIWYPKYSEDTNAMKGFYYLVVDKNGNIQIPKTKVDGYYCGSKAVVDNGKLVWYRTGTSGIREEGFFCNDENYEKIKDLTEVNSDINSDDLFPSMDQYQCTPPIFCSLDLATGKLSEEMTPVPDQLKVPVLYDRNKKKKTLSFYSDKGVTVHVFFKGKEYTGVTNKQWYYRKMTMGDQYVTTIKVDDDLYSEIDKGNEGNDNFVLVWGTKDGMYPSPKKYQQNLQFGHEGTS